MHLLVIEDHPRLANVLKRLLEQDGHVVELAPNGKIGLQIAQDTPGIECVLLDVGLPDMIGLEVARRLRTVRSEMRIVIVTGRDTADDRIAGLAAGADDYLVKPFAFTELAARLRAVRQPRDIESERRPPG
jgi:DNA-binding response OmpR family regulator